MFFSIGLSSTAHAAQNSTTDLWVVKCDTSGNIYLENTQTHEMMTKAFKLDSSGNQIDVDLAEYARNLNKLSVLPSNPQTSIEDVRDIGAIGEPYCVYKYAEGSHWKELGKPLKVTPEVRGAATISYGESTTVSNSFGGGISIDINVSRSIKNGASFTWVWSASTSSSFSTTYAIPSGKIGYVQFRPYLNVTQGTLNQKTYLSPSNILAKETNYYVWGRSPVKLANGFADGIYELITR